MSKKRFTIGALLLLIPLTLYAVDKVKPIVIKNGLNTQVNSTDYLGVKGLAFDSSDSTLIDVSDGDIQVNVDFQLLGNKVIGSTSSGGDLTLNSTTNATKGDLIFDDFVNLWPSIPDISTATTVNAFQFNPIMNIDAGGASDQAVFNVLRINPTTTLGNASTETWRGILMDPSIIADGSTANIISALAFTGTVTTQTAPGFANVFNMFAGNPTLTTNTSGSPPAAINPMYGAAPTFSCPNLNCSTTANVGFTSNPTFSTSGSSGSLTGSTVGFLSAPVITASTSGGGNTITAIVGMRVDNPNYTSTGLNIISEDVGFRFTNHSQSSGNRTVSAIKAIDLQQNSGTGVYNIYAAGTAQNIITGKTRLGSTSDPANELDVTGNILIDNTGTAGQLRFREPSGSGSNYTAFKAQAQSGDITYTLPPDDGDAGEFLKTDGSGSLTWEVPGGSTAHWSSICFGDTTFSGSATVTMVGPGNTVAHVVMPYAGKIEALSCSAGTARTGGSATFKAMKNGSADATSANHCVIDGSPTQYNYVDFGTATSFSAGDQLMIQIVTSSWTPTASDPGACLWISKD